MTALIWVHADALSRCHPVFTTAPQGARVIYIWDAEDLARRNWSLKRCVFVLECLANMKVELVRGRTEDVLATAKADQIFTASTPDPQRRRIIDNLSSTITVVDDRPFVDVPDGTDMGRFFRYWNKAKRSAMQPTEAPQPQHGIET